MIRLSEPCLGGNEWRYVKECLDTNWVSSGGPFVERFEREFARRHGTPGAVATASGTAALHVALVALGVGPGDEVIVPDLTFIATANPVAYVGATPVLADVEEETWTLSPQAVEKAITRRTRAILPVHLFGHPAPMAPLLDIARRHGLLVVEDATEALGSLYGDRPVGTLGDAGCFSFNGNKIVTTGGGGMVLARDAGVLQRVRSLTTQARSHPLEYLHAEVGFNYRLTNLQAALGVAQLEQLDGFVARRREIAGRYRDRLHGEPGLRFATAAPGIFHNWWLSSVLVDAHEFGTDRSGVIEGLGRRGIEARPFFAPLHVQPPYRTAARGSAFPVSTRLHANGVNLPSSVSLDDRQVAEVADALLEVGRAARARRAAAAQRVSRKPGGGA
ncbi:MAG: aminotransferase class I/II-fold pyridoxal phosphate-dependent enzyme [Planctomycetes bacterium]|nr:aminotransferase class I/II-fold pyridoxal phosphate-dependent enzyme [Planctomycetota bacterium]